jgi:hypothetical protein
MPPIFPDRNRDECVGLLLRGLLVDEQHHVAIALVNGFGVPGRHDRPHAVERDVVIASALHVVADDELALAFIGNTFELAVAAVLAVTDLDALGFDTGGGLWRGGAWSWPS